MSIYLFNDVRRHWGYMCQPSGDRTTRHGVWVSWGDLPPLQMVSPCTHIHTYIHTHIHTHTHTHTPTHTHAQEEIIELRVAQHQCAIYTQAADRSALHTRSPHHSSTLSHLTNLECFALPSNLPLFLTLIHSWIFPSRRCERLDVVEQAQQTFGLKPTLPDFYNILLERPRCVNPRNFHKLPLLFLCISSRFCVRCFFTVDQYSDQSFSPMNIVIQTNMNIKLTWT